MTDVDHVKLTARVGDTVTVPLERYAVTGYLWQIAEHPSTGLADLQIMPHRNDGSLVGGRVTEILKLRVVLPGRYEIRLMLRRPWEATPIRSMAISVVARK
jgi:predicted secreted protein